MSVNEIGTVYERPWGHYKTLEIQDGFQVKSITVNPGGRLSLQSHAKRAEHWVVIKGTPTVTINDDVRDYHANQALYIPLQSKHRLENFTQDIVIIVEVQIGSYLGEDDIVRYDDIYGRTP